MLKLTWFGHATLGVETSGYHLLIDPFFGGNPAASTTADKVAADFILVTHGHGDHVGDTVAIARRTGATAISNHEIAGWMGRQGFKAHGQHLGRDRGPRGLQHLPAAGGAAGRVVGRDSGKKALTAKIARGKSKNAKELTGRWRLICAICLSLHLAHR